MRRARDLRDAQDRAAAEEVATALVPKVFTLSARAGSEGRLFGSVTSADIVAAVESQSGVKLDRKRVQLDESIKTLGTHTVPVKLHSDVEFPVTIDVAAE
jgi:large subunit ribosomal protein L9